MGPVKDIGSLLSNEKQIYAYADAADAKREKPLPKYFEMNQRIRYKVRNGDYLGKIVNRYGVSVNSIKRWNNMRSTNIRIGQRLIIYPRKLYVAPKSTTKKSTDKKETPKGKFDLYI